MPQSFAVSGQVDRGDRVPGVRQIARERGIPAAVLAQPVQHGDEGTGLPNCPHAARERFAAAEADVKARGGYSAVRGVHRARARPGDGSSGTVAFMVEQYR